MSIKYRVYWVTQRSGLKSCLLDSLKEVDLHCKHFNVVHIETEVI